MMVCYPCIDFVTLIVFKQSMTNKYANKKFVKLSNFMFPIMSPLTLLIYKVGFQSQLSFFLYFLFCFCFFGVFVCVFSHYGFLRNFASDLRKATHTHTHSKNKTNNKKGENAIQVCIKKRNLFVAKLFVEEGANVNHKDFNGNTPLLTLDLTSKGIKTNKLCLLNSMNLKSNL